MKLLISNNELVDVQSLCEWDASDHDSLLNAVSELLHSYKQHQSSLLKGSRLEYDYNLLLDECSADDVEVYVAGTHVVSSLYFCDILLYIIYSVSLTLDDIKTVYLLRVLLTVEELHLSVVEALL